MHIFTMTPRGLPDLRNVYVYLFGKFLPSKKQQLMRPYLLHRVVLGLEGGPRRRAHPRGVRARRAVHQAGARAGRGRQRGVALPSPVVGARVAASRTGGEHEQERNGRARAACPGRMGWLLGGLLVCFGALPGAFGTVAWVGVLSASSLLRVLLGMFALGLAPVVAGGALLWVGLGVLERQAARSRVWAIDEAEVADAAVGGATARQVADRLGTDPRETERRLDDLVAHDVLSLEVSGEGDLSYRPRGRRCDLHPRPGLKSRATQRKSLRDCRRRSRPAVPKGLYLCSPGF